MKKFPGISIITPTYNSNLDIFKLCLEAIKKQNYAGPIEHILLDGGSTNDCLALGKKYGCQVYKFPELLEQSQERMSIGIKKAKYDIILILETDNIMIGKNWLSMMAEPFLENPEIVSTYSMYNSYEKWMPSLTKYFALFGTNDAFLYYLKKTEKMPLDRSTYDKGQVLSDEKSYVVTRFTPETLPPMGDNGFMVRKKSIELVNRDQKKFIHGDAFYHMVSLGHNTFGVVKNSIIHYSGGSIMGQYKSRLLYKSRFYDKKRGTRPYVTFNPYSVEDVARLIIFIIVSLTIVVPLFRSIRGYFKIHEPAWFLHPIVCLVAVVMYTWSEVSFLIKKYIHV